MGEEHIYWDEDLGGRRHTYGTAMYLWLAIMRCLRIGEVYTGRDENGQITMQWYRGKWYILNETFT